eukprot:2160227-Pleurochrysis_carterae.AAC.3
MHNSAIASAFIREYESVFPRFEMRACASASRCAQVCLSERAFVNLCAGSTVAGDGGCRRV